MQVAFEGENYSRQHLFGLAWFASNLRFHCHQLNDFVSKSVIKITHIFSIYWQCKLSKS